MRKIDPTVIKETLFVSIFAVIFSLLLEAIFLVLGAWDLTVLFGNLLGAFAAVGNFFILALTVQLSLGKGEKEAKNRIKISQLLRFFGLFLVALIGYMLPQYFNIVAVIIPFVFPRFAMTFKALKIKKN